MLRPGDAAPSFVARPVFGLPIPVPPPASARPMVLCFVRNLASPFTRAAMADIQNRYADFDRDGFPLLVITRTDITMARDFVPRHHVLAPVVVDQDGALHRAYQLGTKNALVGTFKTLLSRAGLSSAREAIRYGHGRPHRQLSQLGASFVLGSDGRIRLARYDSSVTDRPDLDGLLACARAC
ncbi:MAG: redoxin domain-containing protein [Oligoflexia bacterium]|nr:redoxin domain-containing protein [Oligoflexia bacterium]